jgi:hypothetical protein
MSNNYTGSYPYSGDTFFDLPKRASFPIESYKYLNVVWSSDTTWQRLSYMVYGDKSMWWLIVAVNNLTDPWDIKEFDEIKVLLPDYLSEVTLYV